MIKHNRHQLKAFNVFSDSLIIFLSYLIAVFLKFNVFGGVMSVNAYEGRFLLGVTVISLILPFCYYIFRPKTVVNGNHSGEYFVIALANGVGTLIIMALFFVWRETDFSRASLAMFWCISSILVILKHMLGRKIIMHYRTLGYSQRHILVIGSGPLAEQYVESIHDSGISGFIIEGYIGEENTNLENHIGEFCCLNKAVQELKPDELVIALEAEEYGQLRQVIEAADKEGLYISMIPFYNNYFPSHPEIETFGKTKLINLRATPLDSIGNAFIKRLVDIIGSLFLIILTSPIMIITSVGVRLSSPGPIFFRQDRVGKDKADFKMLKFRSMKVNAEENTAWSTDVDPRRTRFGSFIRKYSIDELPQFFNVLKGDMSLVGPRPEIPFYVHQFKESIPLYLVRQQVRPGITGWAQVNGLRGDTSIEARVEYDIWYIENWSLWLDIKILFMTVFGGKFKNNEQ